MSTPTYGVMPTPAEVDAMAEDAPTSDLDDIRAEFDISLDNLSEPITVPTRTRYAVRADLAFSSKDVDRWRRGARDPKLLDGVDGTKLGALIIGATVRQITKDGRADWLPGADSVSFQSRELRELLGTRDIATTVLKFYGRPGAVDGTGRRILSDAGYGQDADTALSDPT